MCEAVREFFKDELAAGEALSRAKGRAEGREEGRAESLINNVLNAYRKGWQIVDIADFLGISEEQVKEIIHKDTINVNDFMEVLHESLLYRLYNDCHLF